MCSSALHYLRAACDCLNCCRCMLSESHVPMHVSGPQRVSPVPVPRSALEHSTSAEWRPVSSSGDSASDPAAASLPANPARAAEAQRQADVVQAGATDEDVSDEDACVVCLSARATTGFLHNDSVHRCCCGPCAADVNAAPTKLCPVCRQPYSAVLKVF